MAVAEVDELVGLGTHFENGATRFGLGLECDEGKWNQRQLIARILTVEKHSWLHFFFFN